MGNSPLTLCINQAWEKQTVQVVLPDGQVLFMPHPLTVSMLMQAHPSHFVCQGSPSLLEQRLPVDTKLESGEIYYLLPFPHPVLTPTSAGSRDFFSDCGSGGKPIQQPQVTKHGEKISHRPPSIFFDKLAPPSTFSDLARLNLKPQRCLINLFVFRQTVAAVMPEESFKAGSPEGSFVGDHHYYGPPPPPKRQQRVEPKYSRGTRGRKPALAWKPNLESISETRVVPDFPVKYYIEDLSLSMISDVQPFSTISSPGSSPIHPSSLSLGGPPQPQQYPPRSPLHPIALPHGGQQQQQQYPPRSPLHPTAHPRGGHQQEQQQQHPRSPLHPIPNGGHQQQQQCPPRSPLHPLALPHGGHQQQQQQQCPRSPLHPIALLYGGKQQQQQYSSRSPLHPNALPHGGHQQQQQYPPRSPLHPFALPQGMHQQLQQQKYPSRSPLHPIALPHGGGQQQQQVQQFQEQQQRPGSPFNSFPFAKLAPQQQFQQQQQHRQDAIQVQLHGDRSINRQKFMYSA